MALSSTILPLGVELVLFFSLPPCIWYVFIPSPPLGVLAPLALMAIGEKTSPDAARSASEYCLKRLSHRASRSWRSRLGLMRWRGGAGVLGVQTTLALTQFEQGVVRSHLILRRWHSAQESWRPDGLGWPWGVLNLGLRLRLRLSLLRGG